MNREKKESNRVGEGGHPTLLLSSLPLHRTFLGLQKSRAAHPGAGHLWDRTAAALARKYCTTRATDPDLHGTPDPPPSGSVGPVLPLLQLQPNDDNSDNSNK